MNSDAGRHHPSHVANQDAANNLENKMFHKLFSCLLASLKTCSGCDSLCKSGIDSSLLSHRKKFSVSVSTSGKHAMLMIF